MKKKNWICSPIPRRKKVEKLIVISGKGFSEIFLGATLNIYSGMAPALPDNTPTGTLLVRGSRSAEAI